MGLLVGVSAALTVAQDAKAPVRVTVKDGKVVADEPTLPIDPTVRIRIGNSGGAFFGLSVEGKRISCSPDGSIWSSAKIDNQEFHAGNGDFAMHNPQPLPPGPNGKKREGQIASWQTQGLKVTQTIEVVPSKPAGKGAPGQKRKLDTARITYLVENKDTRPHALEWRVGIDMLINNNDGALYASPTTHPGKVLNGVSLKEKELPEYVQALERPNLQDPGFVAYLTLKHGTSAKVEGPNRIVLTNLGALGNGQWEVPAQPAGDSACALYWPAQTLAPGQKREMVWAYGGGVASNIDNEGKVALALGGSFEPGKLFTVTAYVDDPLPSQTLALELPPGMVRVEGKELQPVPPPSPETGTSLVLWKARVLETGTFDVKVRSSTGVTQIKHITIAK
jgi:hypothetical protein